jgi:hypothetical protein
MNKEQIIDKVYKRYVMLPKELSDVISDNEKFNGRNYTQDEFINKCKTDTEFSETWGLKIEERELSLNDRILEFAKRDLNPSEFRRGGGYGTVIPEEKTLKVLDRHNIPTKLITITYNDTKLESYE